MARRRCPDGPVAPSDEQRHDGGAPKVDPRRARFAIQVGHSKEEWFERFQRSLDTVTQNVATLTQNVDKLREGLMEEVGARKVAVATVGGSVSVNNALIVTGIAVVAGIVGGIIVHLLKL